MEVKINTIVLDEYPAQSGSILTVIHYNDIDQYFPIQMVLGESGESADSAEFARIAKIE